MNLESTADQPRPPSPQPALLHPLIQSMTGVLGLFALAGLAWLFVFDDPAVQNAPHRNPLAIEPYRIDLNTATKPEWMLLPGIGLKTAQRILADRDQNGPFESLDDLQRVAGIGPKTVAEIKPYIAPVQAQLDSAQPINSLADSQSDRAFSGDSASAINRTMGSVLLPRTNSH